MTPSEPQRLGYREIAAKLRDEINQGVYAEELKLPTQGELCERFGVSRMTVSHALAELQRSSIIYTIQGKGIFITPPSSVPPTSPMSGLAEDLNNPQGKVVYCYFNSLADADAALSLLVIEHPRLDPIEIRVLMPVGAEGFEPPKVPGAIIRVRHAETPLQPMIRLTTGDAVMSLHQDGALAFTDECVWIRREPVYVDTILKWFEDEWALGEPQGRE